MGRKKQDKKKWDVSYPWDFKSTVPSRCCDSEITKLARQMKREGLAYVNTGDIMLEDNDGYIYVYQLIAESKKKVVK